ncbi:DUF1127 domain-containing protein [Neoaquamicrobium sediminum]|uniref:DUF1127 domain-containing protein n=1 Tax=Neoaquamicrobium sediminum TaxID=1849104 RepID=A0ABV3WUZ4_9HYPH
MKTIHAMQKNNAPEIVTLRRWRQEYLRRVAGAFWRAIREIRVRAERQRSRRLLLEMTDAQLRDIGVSRPDAAKEARRTIWD